MSHVQEQRAPSDRYRRQAMRAVSVGLLAALGGALTGPASPASAAGEVEYQSLSINPERLGVEQLGLTIGAQPEWSWMSDEEVQLRIPSALVSAVPDAVEYSWLGEAGELRWETTSPNGYAWAEHQALFTLSTAQVDLTSEEDPLVYFSLSNPVAPGAFGVYTPPGEGATEIRWGTGAQRDGSPQDLDSRVGLPPETAMFPTKASFSSSGMYCFDVTTTATVTDWDWDNYDEESGYLPLLPGMDPVSVTKTVRIAVGDEVAADAECGTATNETPVQQAPVPDVPNPPTASVNGTTVTVDWEPPASEGGSPISTYTVTLSNNVITPLVQTVDGKTTSATFEGVPPGRYNASVVASNESGDSRASNPSPWVIVDATESETLVIASGHIDGIAPQIDTDESGRMSLALRAHHDGYDWLEWDDFVLYSNDTATRALPSQYRSEDDWSFIGDAGSRVWVSPQIQQNTLPWVGLSTEHSSIYENIPPGDTIGVRIEAVTGHDGGPAPGAFAMSQSGNGYGAPVNGVGLYGSTVEGLPSGFKIGPGAHQHYSWSFTEPGIYCVAVAVDATLPDGQRHTARGLLTHVVGETVDPTAVQPCETVTDYPAVGSPPSTEPPATDAPFVFKDGFGDLSLTLSEGDLSTSLLHSGSYRNALPERYDPESVVFRGALNYYAGNSDGKYYFGRFPDPRAERDSAPYLSWDTLGVAQDRVAGDISWRVDDVRGPGEFGIEDRSSDPGKTVFDTAEGVVEAGIWSQSETSQPVWYVTQPGRYCIDLTWSVETADGREASSTKTITVVADGEGFTHDGGTLTKTCADGAESTEPGNGTDPDPEPGDDEQPWDVPNWTETESGARILNRGHVDVASLVEDGKLVTKIRDTTTEGAEAGRESGWVSWHQPEDTVFQLLPAAEQQVPERGAYAFLGEPGDRFWLAPETQNNDLLWPGWSTEHIPAGALETGVEWRLTGSQGPGEFFIYATDPESMAGKQLVHFNTSNGIDEHDVVPIGARNHVHGNWAFTAEGVYCLAFERTARLADGTPVSDPFTLAVAVGETDPTVVDPANCEATEPDATVPDAPAKPDVSVEGDAVTTSWEAPANGGSSITGYTVQLLGGEQPLVKEVPADVTETVFERVPEGTYTATVVAVNAVGGSPASAASDEVTVADVTDPEATAPAAPPAPTATVTGTAVTVAWAAPADGGSRITGYRVELNGGAAPVRREVTADAKSVVLGNLQPGNYTATVVAINQVGESEKSAPSPEVTVAAVPDPGPAATVPEAPAAPTAEVNGSEVSVAWSAPADGGSRITGYTVTLTGATADPLVQETGADTTTAVFSTVPAGTYAATVTAVNAKGASDASAASADIVVKSTDGGTPGEEHGDQASPVPDSELTNANRGGVDVPDAAARGQQVTVKVGGAHAGEQLRVWLHSNPALLATVAVDPVGNTQVTIPNDAVLGDHKIVVQTVDGTLIGWDGIKIGTASQVGPNGEWLAATGHDAGLMFPLAAGATLLLLLGAGTFVGAAARRRKIPTG